MFDIGWQELFIIAVIAIVVVGPKDLPRVLRTVGIWVGRAKSMMREFQGHVDDMVREAELDDFKKQIEQGKGQLTDMVENSIDPKGEMRDAMEYGGEEFAGYSGNPVTDGEYMPPSEEAPGEETPGDDAPREEAPGGDTETDGEAQPDAESGAEPESGKDTVAAPDAPEPSERKD